VRHRVSILKPHTLLTIASSLGWRKWLNSRLCESVLGRRMGKVRELLCLDPSIHTMSSLLRCCISTALRPHVTSALPAHSFAFSQAVGVVAWHKDLLDEACAEDPAEYLLDPLPLREGPPPSMLRGQPHRQLTQLPTASFAKQAHDCVFTSMFSVGENRLKSANGIGATETGSRQTVRCVPCDSNLMVGVPSLYEGTGAKSLRYRDLGCCPAHIKVRKGEWAHQHTMDKSWHVLLSPRDARKVLQAGWGEMWPIACLDKQYAPPGYTLLFAPRDEREVRVFLGCMQAAHKNSQAHQDRSQVARGKSGSLNRSSNLRRKAS
jgi:hypothetical protein